MAGNINRVVLVGNLTRIPSSGTHRPGHRFSSLRLAVNTRRKDESGQWTDKPNYFDITVWGQQERTVRSTSSKGSLRRDRRATRMAGGRRRTARSAGRRGRRRERPVPRQPAGRGVLLRAGRRDGGHRGWRRRRDFPSLTNRRRHPLLGAHRWHRRNNNHAGAPDRRLPPASARAVTSAGTRSRRSTTRTCAASPLHLGEGEDPLAPHHGRLPEAPDPGRLGGEAGARWLFFRTSASHGSHPSGRREARPAR